MAPARTSRRNRSENNVQNSGDDVDDPSINRELFIDPMLGSSLAIYVEKDVDDRNGIIQLITKHGGSISPGYSGVPYILVDPHKPSGQNLWRQYVGKKGKIVLSARWVRECVKAGQLQTYHSNWAGCKVTGKEQVIYPPQVVVPGLPSNSAHVLHSQPIPSMPPIDPLLHPFYQPTVFGHGIQAPQETTRVLHSEEPAPPQTWQASSAVAPQQTHVAPSNQTTQQQIIHRPTQSYREDAWDGYAHNGHTGDDIAPPPASYDYRYRDDQPWVAASNPYYDPTYDQSYGQSSYIEPSPPPAAPNPQSGTSTTTNAVAGPSTAPESTDTPGAFERGRGRRKTKAQPTRATSPSALVINRNPPTRSPTPPTRIIKSTYGGNLFTADDVLYLKKYIDYCQDQGLVLSLREICERIAVKAPHHTFYSWRRYCNKHQIRLSGYLMSTDRSPSPPRDESERDLEMELEMAFDEDDSARGRSRMRSVNPAEGGTRAVAGALATTGTSSTSVGGAGNGSGSGSGSENTAQRTRSPTPPRALYRSTTGKGVAFTTEDVTFLVKFMEYRKSQGKVDMVAFWKDVATKAPHHSRASWMKFWRRHKHELNHTDGDEPLPQPPDKKMRYSREDDILLAKYFFNKPSGTSDKIFQAFGRLHPHHPWKGWQEHNRIHKAKIEHFKQLLAAGHDIDSTLPV